MRTNRSSLLHCLAIAVPLSALPAAARAVELGEPTNPFESAGSSVPERGPASPQATSFLDQQIAAAQATANDLGPDSPCAAISQNASGSDDGFYWEIGDANGVVADPGSGLRASGSVQPANTGPDRYTRTRSMQIASASKWLYGSYVAQTTAQNVNGQWRIPAAYVPFLNFTSGYDNMAEENCSSEATVGDCAAADNNAISPQPNDTRTSADIGRFDYNPGHLQVLESVDLNGAGHTDADLAHEVTAAMAGSGVAMNLSFVEPVPAGGGMATPAGYASFLQALLSTANPPVMSFLLKPTASDPYAVCTNPYDSSCVDGDGQAAAVYSPTPPSVSWHYSITHWIEDDPQAGDGAYSSPGAYGFYPWIDATKTWYGIVARYDNSFSLLADSTPYYKSVMCGEAIRTAFVTGVSQP